MGLEGPRHIISASMAAATILLARLSVPVRIVVVVTPECPVELAPDPADGRSRADISGADAPASRAGGQGPLPAARRPRSPAPPRPGRPGSAGRSRAPRGSRASAGRRSLLRRADRRSSRGCTLRRPRESRAAGGC